MDLLRQEIGRIVGLCLKTLRKQGFKVSVFLLTDKEMQALNLKFRKSDKPTSVLSFESPSGFVSPEKELGEIFLAPNYIRKQGQTLEKILIHGVLHLAGYNHKTKNDRIKMQKKERQIVDLLSKKYAHNRFGHRFFKHKSGSA